MTTEQKQIEFDMCVFKKVILNPITCHAMLQMILDRGATMNIKIEELTHEEKGKIILQIISELYNREIKEDL